MRKLSDPAINWTCGTFLITISLEIRLPYVKAKSFLLPLSFLTLLIFFTVSSRSQTVINFDDMSTSTNAVITNGYHGLIWTNFDIINAPLFTKTAGPNGYNYGMVTASNVAFNFGGIPAEIDSFSTNFNFSSAYLTGVWRSNLNIEVQGFGGTNLLYDTIVVPNATNPTLFTFNYLNINRLTFNSFGGQPAGFAGLGAQFAMDNFTFEFVPEPSTLLLATLAVVMLWPILKRKRAQATR